MNPRLLGVLAAAAVVMGVVLYLFFSNQSSATPPAPTESGSAVATNTAHDVPRMPSLDHPGTGTHIETTDVPRDPDAGSGSAVPEYTVGGIKVRDHRGGSNKPLDVPPNPHPANARQLPPALTTAISQKVREVVYACVADAPRTARGAKPKVDGQLTTAIKDHLLVVTGVVAQVRDLEAPYQDQIKSCVEQNAVHLTAAAADQADIADYGIGVTFALP